MGNHCKLKRKKKNRKTCSSIVNDDRFLKVSNELASSCLEFGKGKDPGQKMMDIADIMRSKAINAAGKRDKFGGIRKKLTQIRELGKNKIEEEETG